jgi:hypothetical protein
MNLDQAKREVEEARRKFAHAVHLAKLAKRDYDKACAQQVDIEFAIAEATLRKDR